MLISEIFTWWYTEGIKGILRGAKEWLGKIVDFFSMGSLVKTLFMPYRQISAAKARADAPMDLKLRMFGDRLFSRIMGFFVRIILLLVGTVMIILGTILILLLIIVWPFIPAMPIIGIILTLVGVV